jgi:hypothetical protein
MVLTGRRHLDHEGAQGQEEALRCKSDYVLH